MGGFLGARDGARRLKLQEAAELLWASRGAATLGHVHPCGSELPPRRLVCEPGRRGVERQAELAWPGEGDGWRGGHLVPERPGKKRVLRMRWGGLGLRRESCLEAGEREGRDWVASGTC